MKVDIKLVYEFKCYAAEADDDVYASLGLKGITPDNRDIHGYLHWQLRKNAFMYDW